MNCWSPSNITYWSRLFLFIFSRDVNSAHRVTTVRLVVLLNIMFGGAEMISL